MELKRKIFSYKPDLSGNLFRFRFGTSYYRNFADDHLRSERYLNHLLGLSAERKLNDNDVSAELQKMIVAGTKT
jgi:hypothetical protein